MERRSCGKDGPEISVLGIGCWAFGGGDYWGPQDQADVDAIVGLALDRGINFFDTAEAYNDGRSEMSLGRALAGFPRQSAVIGTKVPPCFLYPTVLEQHLDASLKRLGCEYIDLYMVHWPLHPIALTQFGGRPENAQAPPRLEDVVDCLNRCVEKGKVLHLGVSNFGPRPLAEIRAAGLRVFANQLPYSPVARAVEYEILPYCVREGIGGIGYMSLWQGLLSGRFRKIEEVPLLRRRTRQFSAFTNPLSRHGEPGAERELQSLLDQTWVLSRTSGLTLLDLTVGWLVSKAGLSCALCGTRSPEQLEKNIEAASRPLPADLTLAIDTITEPLRRALGPSIDYFESSANDRTR